MRISKQWLHDWVEFDSDIEALSRQLTMAGLEVDGVEPAIPDLAGVIIGEVISCEPHPNADRLRLCQVDSGSESLQIVCGAPNVAAGVRVPVATVGTRLPGGMKIKPAKLRGVASNGMLCSTTELGLGADTGGLWLLPDDAPVGQPLVDYLGGADTIYEIDLTPNRGDCLSTLGVAREVAIAFDKPLLTPRKDKQPEVSEIGEPGVIIAADELCAVYSGRLVQGIDSRVNVPMWMQERLRRVGIRTIHPAVDIGNYIMLDIGQPMHAFDADKLVGGIQVRRAAEGEHIVTLDGQDVTLQESTLVIADDEGPVAIAGMIGGQRTAVDESTRNVLFEAACFTPAAVAGQGRRYKIHTDSLHRYERGVDPHLYEQAQNQAGVMLTRIAGGTCGHIKAVEGQPVWTGDRHIVLRGKQIARLLGQAIPKDFIETALLGLGAKISPDGADSWNVIPPSWRYDLAIEADLIEEVARLYGYDRLTTGSAGVMLPAARIDDSTAEGGAAEEVLRQRGYHEAITYSFVDPELHAELEGNARSLRLDNPISEQMIDMRRTLWAGLLKAWDYNARRQQTRVRLFESGLRFVPDESAEYGIDQIDTVAGLAAGPAQDPSWDATDRELDFFDLRGDVEALFAGHEARPEFHAETHPALHPGCSARIYLDGKKIGWAGQLAPAFAKHFKGQVMPYLFEIDRSALLRKSRIRYEALSDQPKITRDLALVVPQGTAAGDLTKTVENIGSNLLQSVSLFDIFYGDELGEGLKSLALRLIFQDKSSTLSDETVEREMAAVVDVLKECFDARIRGANDTDKGRSS